MITLREAAFAFGWTLQEIVRTIDEHPELTPKIAYGNRTLRVLGKAELLYLETLDESGELLSPKGRRALHEALVTWNTGETVTVGPFVLPLGRLLSRVERRLDALDRLKGSVEGDPEDPRIKGTDIALYRISTLLDGGATVEQVAEDYPLLTMEQIETARDYAAAIPKKGRPYPRQSFKRAMRSLGLDALDESDR